MDAGDCTRLIMQEIISKKELQEFGLLIGIGFPLFIGLLIPTLTGHGFKAWTLWIGSLGLISRFTFP